MELVGAGASSTIITRPMAESMANLLGDAAKNAKAPSLADIKSEKTLMYW
ncbi:hypothetical protein [Pyrobaculum aerophilum]|nr:hypothetical protein [Pyrobaculum aerophilum]